MSCLSGPGNRNCRKFSGPPRLRAKSDAAAAITSILELRAGRIWCPAIGALQSLIAGVVRASLATVVEASAHLRTDQAPAFAAAGRDYAAHDSADDSVNHSKLEYFRGDIHVNSADSFNDRLRRTVAGVFHHISPNDTDRYVFETASKLRTSSASDGPSPLSTHAYARINTG